VRSAARVARRAAGVPLPPQSIAPSQTALRQALDQHSTIITEDLARAELELAGSTEHRGTAAPGGSGHPLYTKADMHPKSRACEREAHWASFISIPPPGCFSSS